MGRSTVHYADNKTNNALKKLHNKLRPAGTPVQRVEYIIELLLLRIFETKIKQDEEFKPLRKLFTTGYRWKNHKTGQEESNENRLFSYLSTVSNDQILSELNDNFFPFYSTILQSARKVFENNLPQKVQDQLVLIEEVFSNSNFTNNVNSGNLGEVISIVANDIEEARLLKTDLLGDAIESALSETGGTKDIGLFRTPDHVRQFMTALLEPGFDDIIFDPACGTGGFLFDAFEFVMQRYLNDKAWPGEKGHSELKKWFSGYFKNNPIEMPTDAQTKQFYRSGVSGIEYLGMIRKMAAINFYIRGLNPANIVQGDSLAKYNPVTDHESKSIVLANPPFGAERDQESYPEVWGEYSKESETTILFVKLMFELLKQGGKCAVVVSEGFHTWDQFSAKALRKMLLEEAQLKAVISLPQGLFVSKSGQGPKTSVLLFEKGGTTDWVWFYKVTNDGYTMGTNRKEQKGNQLVECLTLYHKYVKNGKQPAESKHQFCIPAEWIKALDPRIKERIRTETRTDMETKGVKEREKKEKDLNTKVKAKKITEAEKQMELKIFDQSLENRIQNEIAKRIDKAHTYSFNLANYKSTLSESQIEEWNETLKHIQPNGATTVDEVYKKLKASKPENILPYLLKLNPENALEADIAREYIATIDENILHNQKELETISEIIKSGAKYPMVKLKEYLVLNEDKIKPSKNPELNYKVLGVSNEIGIFLNENLNAEETNQSYYLVKKNEFCYNPYRINVGSIGLNTYDYENQIISGAYIVFGCKEDELNPKYLDALLSSKGFLEYVNDKANGGVRMNFKFEDIEAWEIPLPSIDEQTEIISQIEKQKSLIDGIEKVIKNYDFDFINKYEWKREKLSVCCNELVIGNTPTGKVKDEGEIIYLKVNNLSFDLSLDFKNQYFIDKETHNKDLKRSICYSGDVLMNIVGPPLGKVSIVPDEIDECNINQAIICFRPKDYIDKRYLAYYLLKKSTVNKFIENIRRSTGQWNLTKTICSEFEIDFPEKDEQIQIVKELDSKMNIINGLLNIKTDSIIRINNLLSNIWGIEYVEPTEMEVEE